MLDTDESDVRRPLGLTMLTGLYFFFFLVSASTFGNPFPFLGVIYQGNVAKFLVFVDCLICLYLFLGTMKRQYFTWFLLIGYNLFQIVNTIVNLTCISRSELERVLGERVNGDALIVNNVAAALAILLLTQYIYRHKHFFSNRQKYLF
ncbi:MAG TPA: hypothetical protein VI389_08085 [Geobacteraceae bacterium]